MEKGEPGDSHPIISEWERGIDHSDHVMLVQAILEPDMSNLHVHMSPELSLLLAYLRTKTLGSGSYLCFFCFSFLLLTPGCISYCKHAFPGQGGMAVVTVFLCHDPRGHFFSSFKINGPGKDSN
jgi:hypothetical protein